MKKRYYNHAVRVLRAIWKDCMTYEDREWGYLGNRSFFISYWAGKSSYADVFTWKFDWILEKLKTSHIRRVGTLV